MKQLRDGSSLRSPKTQRRWHQYTTKHKIADCDFCEYNDSLAVIKQCNYFLVIRNLFPYTMWDEMDVLDHLMLIPKRHIESLSELSTEESCEYIELLGAYEDKGYSAYSRSHKNSQKSVPHQHTHLIQTGSRRKKLMLFIRKPHVLISR